MTKLTTVSSDGPHMINVTEHNIPFTLPHTSVRMILAQPFLELCRPASEPFPLSSDCTARLIRGIGNVIELARKVSPHFILFPEFTIPGALAVQQLISAMASQDVATPCALIGGVTGLTRDEYASLFVMNSGVVTAHATNSPTNVAADQWVNTSIAIIKDDAGHLNLWLQPKIIPSWPEATTHHQKMFRGQAVTLFRASFDNGFPLRFFSLLCFDWAGEEAGQSPLTDVINYVEAAGKGVAASQSLQWAFVLQHNKRPNHHTFVGPANTFLTDRSSWPFVERRDAAVVMVGTASSLPPGRTDEYGFSSIIYGPIAPFDNRACVATVCYRPKRLRGTDGLGECKDTVFREMGECTHFVALRVPNFVRVAASERIIPTSEAEVHPFADPSSDPRIPGAAVPAPVKWANDEIDLLPDLCTTHFAGSPLETAVKTAQLTSASEYRRLESKVLAQRIQWACASRCGRSSDPADDGDDWSTTESDGLNHVMSTLTLVGAVQSLDLNDAAFHGRERVGGVEIAAIRGRTHEECMAGLKAIAAKTYSPILFISRDHDNSPCLPRELTSFTDPRGGSGVKLSDANSVLTKAKTSDLAQFDAFIKELLNVPERRIV